ncbi:MAG: glutamine--fructose-6-phosphate transaminase (isomerizing) [Patescibacteria group bacterium]
MCGIMGYVGKRNALPIVIDGLKKLEYRGYDSAGVALLAENGIFLAKKAGRVAELEQHVQGSAFAKASADKSVSDIPKGNLAIAHTRWATHGKPTDINAHPHSDCKKEIFIVHNGIIENHQELKEALQREGHIFSSETDSEVIAHLIERQLIMENKISLEDAVTEALGHVTGTFGVAVISKKDGQKIVAARRGSPLILGVGDGEYVLASDASAIVGVTKQAVYLHDNELVSVSPDGFHIFNLSKKPLEKNIQTIEWDTESAQKGGFSHFMKKEIFEQPETLKNSLRGRLMEDGFAKLGGLEDVKERFLSSKQISIIACGTSYYAGMLGKYFFEEIAGIPVSVERASEFRYRNPVMGPDYTAIFISQSGETADTIHALREAKKRGALTLGIVNVVGSTLARESDAGVYNHAGPEIGVASTKAFLSQIGVLMLIALFLKKKNGASSTNGLDMVHEFKALPSKMEKILKRDSEIKSLAQKYLSYSNFAFIGRKYQFPVALEGALKLKEIAYRYAEGYAAGELKHGPLALIDGNMPVIALAVKDSIYEKVISNIEEVKARGGKVIAIASESDKRIGAIADDVIFIPESLEMLSPMLSVIPLQLFAYHTAALLGLDVDKPRNLAKSVTVE